MTREFIIMPEFDRQWKSMNLSDIHLQQLQGELIIDPRVGAVIQHTNGLRKYRFALPGRGKSGSVRVIYVDFPAYEKTYLITTYPKNIKDNLTSEEKQIIAKLIRELGDELRKKVNG